MAETTMVDVRVFEPATVAVLQPWLAMAPQITEMAQLSTVVQAMRALWWEWSAAEWCAMATRTLSSVSSVEGAAAVIERLVQAENNLLYACKQWTEAGVLFPEQAGVQHERLASIVPHVHAWIIQVCDAWGLPVPVRSEHE